MTENKIALVTGSNRGIGLAVVTKLAEKGFLVYLTARNAARGEKAAADLKKMNFNVQFLELDVRDSNSVVKAVKLFSKESDHLDVLINNAGILPSQSESILQTSLASFEEAFKTNSLGPLLVTQLFLPFLRKSKRARVINVSSGAGALNSMDIYAPAYSVSKTALNAVTVQLANSLQSDGISVNAMCPGWVRTDMGGAGAPRSVKEGAEGIVWLATEAPQKLTGQFLRDHESIPW